MAPRSAHIPAGKEGCEFGEKDCRRIVTLWSCLDFCLKQERKRSFDSSCGDQGYGEISPVSVADAVCGFAVRAVCLIRRHLAIHYPSAARLHIPHAALLSVH